MLMKAMILAAGKERGFNDHACDPWLMIHPSEAVMEFLLELLKEPFQGSDGECVHLAEEIEKLP